jgi:hypothetical protein
MVLFEDARDAKKTLRQKSTFRKSGSKNGAKI